MTQSRMLIDLTQDSESEDQIMTKPPRLFSANLAHREFSSTIPLKRKSDRDSDSSASPLNAYTSVLQPNNGNINNIQATFKVKRRSEPYTPSPALESGSGTDLCVVVPSPSAQLKREIDTAEYIHDGELIALSQKFYPTDALEKRAARGTYPAARSVKRETYPFRIGNPGPFLTERERKPVVQTLCESLRRKLATIRGPPVTVAPGDEERLAQSTSSFEFVNKYKLRNGVAPIGQEFLAGCSCEEVCDPARCSCLTQEENSNERIIPYKTSREDSRFWGLSPEFMQRTSMIYECNALCGCNERCWNRVITQGRKVKLEIFFTGTRGFGQFIDLYLGEVITTTHADRREKAAAARNAPSYLFSLDFFINDDTIYVVDGCNFGAATRFINHSCNPNCKMFTVSRNHGDERLYDLAFFAVKDIKPGVELTFDYNPHMERVDKVAPGAVPCLCGEPNCRGQLWANKKKRRERF
ncbi:hypothetical protein ASPCAL09003 [Aspergillus calidoustus]|uniref:Histone-lysine N-methyltransferase n=1 Tax=Aspergillus calidoustus TaxID=454130 RepID=A0A0U5CRB5_ASPCI|nr:hypothetical protein ASPCAL09003 [Aspergillus calidoustus]